MEYSTINEIDLKLALLGGDSIEVGNLAIKPYKLREIRKYGYSKYMQNLQWISVSIDDFIGSVLDIEKRMFLESKKSTLKAFDFYIKLGGKDLLSTLLGTLKMIFKTDDVRVLDESVIALDFVKLGIIEEDEYGNVINFNEDKLDSLSEDEIKLIHRDNFDNIVNVVKLQNYLEKPKSAKSEENPADEATRKLMEHMKKMNEKVEAKKKRQQGDDEEEVDFSDIVSAVSSRSNSINKLNIWWLTLYQLYDEYARLELIDNYDFSIKAMMAGAEKVDLKHWSSKL